MVRSRAISQMGRLRLVGHQECRKTLRAELLGWLLPIVMGLVSTEAVARVFDFKRETFAPYVRAGGILSRLGADAFTHSSGTQTTFPGHEKVAYNLLGEVGASFQFGSLGLRLGVEALRPDVVHAVGKSSGGTELMKVQSEIFAFVPSLTLEFHYARVGMTRFFGILGGGLAQVSVDNGYVLTSDGQTLYGKSDYKEKSSAWVNSAHAGFGFETHLADSATFSMDFGFRHLMVSGLRLKHPIDSLAQGPMDRGALLLRQDLTQRRLDLGGFFVALSFRFYVQF